MRPFRRFTLLLALFLLTGCGEKIVDGRPQATKPVQGAEELVGLEMTRTERDLMAADLVENRNAYADLRAHQLGNEHRPALRFDPLMAGKVPGDLADTPAVWSNVPVGTRPADLNDLAFATIGELGALLRAGEVTCVELTELALARLREHDPQLFCVVNLTEEQAIYRAAQLDAMLNHGIDLGPLHGIPYGAKDLLAVEGYPTTWGATPYENQRISDTATVCRKLHDAGAVLVAKLTLGALAWGDVWFDGKTRNPWNLEQGSSGSSAGPASAVAAGLVPFAMGSETWGSIVSPSTRCGVTGLRPTFGRVSKAGAMALSWTMDKLGPMARSVEDCAMVLDAIRGADPRDPTAVDAPFPYSPEESLAGRRIGYLEAAFEESGADSALNAGALEVLREAGAEMVPVAFDLEGLGIEPSSLAFVLSAEAGAAFQDLTLSDRDDELVRQVRYAWPNVFRQAQFIPAVEYIQANRHRMRLVEMVEAIFAQVDVYMAPSFGGDNLLVTNLTGHPQVVLPNGFIEVNSPHSITFVGRLHDEAKLLGVAKAYQDATGWHRDHPEGY
ncbi:MAG: amidase [bacterium]|nr:amidase [bacterium]